MEISKIISEIRVLPVMLLAVALIIRYVIGKRRFGRRGVGGLQHFRSYGTSIFVLFFEWLFSWIANLLIITGLIMLIYW